MRLPFEVVQEELNRVLVKQGFTSERAAMCAQLFTETHRDGVYSHGLNRFARFIHFIQKGYVDVAAVPELVAKKGVLERWDGQQGPGNLNAQFAMQQAINMAKENGIGGVALRNTNHWMRGGTYGWQAAEAGCMGICFTNTSPNMPPWGGTEAKLGNNPLILAVPRENGEHVVLDMAMTQFSYGKMQIYAESGKELPVLGGYDAAGNLTQDAKAIYAAQRPMPIGFWKGSGLSMMLDLIAALLAGGRTTQELGELEEEYGISQVFICFEVNAFSGAALAEKIIKEVIAFTKSSPLVNPETSVLYPGENTLRLREENSRLGLPVDEQIWEKILAM